MENTLNSGDVILINRRIKYTSGECDVYFNSFFQQNSNIEPRNKFVTLVHELHKISQSIGFYSYIDRNDIVVVQGFHDKSPLVIKRVVALPGDTITIVNSKVYINDNPLEETGSVSKQYIVSISDHKRLNSYLESYNFRKNKIPSAGSNDLLMMNLTNSELKKFYTLDLVDSIHIINTSMNDCRIYPDTMIGKWTSCNYGPFMVPGGGLYNNSEMRSSKDTSSLLSNKKLSLFNKTECQSSRLNGGIDSVVMNCDGFFIIGDNRSFSLDSRHYGPIPTIKVIGKKILILKSHNKVSELLSIWLHVRLTNPRDAT